jgi:hypothetical protein
MIGPVLNAVLLVLFLAYMVTGASLTFNLLPSIDRVAWWHWSRRLWTWPSPWATRTNTLRIGASMLSTGIAALVVVGLLARTSDAATAWLGGALIGLFAMLFLVSAVVDLGWWPPVFLKKPSPRVMNWFVRPMWTVVGLALLAAAIAIAASAQR